jgi:hypothetical protein
VGFTGASHRADLQGMWLCDWPRRPPDLNKRGGAEARASYAQWESEENPIAKIINAGAIRQTKQIRRKQP